jgi:sulfite exporter TauE/SafE
MIELPLVFLGGLLGSSHCVGMCGGFAMLIGMGQTSWRRNLIAQFAYSGGRIFTYVVLGAVAGFIGMKLSRGVGGWVNIPATMCVIAGLFLIVEGLAAAGFDLRRWRKTPRGAALFGCGAFPLFGALLRTPGFQNAFFAGLLSGFMPCGLVYAMLSLAASTGDLLRGLAVMATFGAGTVPLMVLTGTTISLLSAMRRQQLMRLAAWCVVLTGVVTLARGAGFLSLPGTESALQCPFCAQKESRHP